MKILFITSTNLGDGILSTGALDHFARLYPDADITVACGPVLAGLFRAAPRVSRVIALKKEPYAGHWRKLLAATMLKKWDIVVDLRNSIVSRLVWSGKKHIWTQSWPDMHKVEQVARVIGAGIPPAPHIWLDEEAKEKARLLLPDDAARPVLGMAPAARWPGKEWPPEYFAALARQLTDAGGPMAGWRVAVFAAPGEERQGRAVYDALPEDRRIDLIAKTSPLEAAAALARCAFYVGNDSGLTHAAAAVGVPTLALFGVGFPELYRPWGAHAAYVSTPESREELISAYRRAHNLSDGQRIRESLLRSLTVEKVYGAITKMMTP